MSEITAKDFYNSIEASNRPCFIKMNAYYEAESDDESIFYFAEAYYAERKANEADTNTNKALNIDPVSDSFQADIRNKLSPISNLIEMIEDTQPRDLLADEVKQAKKSVEILSNYR